MLSWLKWFPRLGDFSQRLQGIVWLVGVLFAIVTILFSVGEGLNQFFVSTTLVSRDIRADLFFPVAIALLAMLSAQTISLAVLMKRRTKLQEITLFEALKNDAWATLQRACRLVDDAVAVAAGNNVLSNNEKFVRVTQIVLGACKDAVLMYCDQSQTRLAYLRYDRDADKFEVVAQMGLRRESFTDVEELSKNEGLAGKALKSREVLCVHDVRDGNECMAKGYKAIGLDPPRHGTIAVRGVWADKQPVGVLCVDHPEPKAFTQDDLEVIDRFGDKVAMLYYVFSHMGVAPPQSHQ